MGKESKGNLKLPTINRSVAIVTPKRPFFDWCREALEDTELTFDDLIATPGVYLLPDCELDTDKLKYLDQYFDLIFEEELAAWVADDSLWPADRRFKVFCEWFNVHLSSMVVDLVDGPLDHDE